VERDRPPAGEAMNASGEPTVPRQAATIIVLRDGTAGLEVLLVRRTEQARFMAGVWVFPGGAVDAEEGEGDAAHRAAAVRELRDETGIALDDPHALLRWSRWITPPEILIRFDTHFFVAALPAGQEPTIDGTEIIDFGWFTPAGALAAYEREEIALVFPTIKHLEQLQGFADTADLLARAAGREVRPVVPHVVTDGEVARIVLPEEPSPGA
jgi:8-oxo-dGTP pyrophosphatase MutT (NUDIX family)